MKNKKVLVTGSSGFTPWNNFKFMVKMYYTYVLKSLIDNDNYTGYTENLKLIFEQHNKGEVDSTKNRRPLKLIYFEGCLNRDDATRREKYLKTYYGKMFIKKRLSAWFLKNK